MEMSEEYQKSKLSSTPTDDYAALLTEIEQLFELARDQNWEGADNKWSDFSTHFDIVQNKYSKVNWDDYPKSERDTCAQTIAKIVDFHDLLIDLIKVKQSKVQSELSSLATSNRLSKAYK